MAEDNFARKLAMLGFISFGLFDTITTACVGNFLGFENETSNLVRLAGTSTGVLGSILVKIVVTEVVMLTVVYVAERYPVKYTARGCLVGAILSGLFAGFSNLNILKAGYSYFLYGIDAQMMAIMIIAACFASGLITDILNYSSRSKLRALQ